MTPEEHPSPLTHDWYTPRQSYLVKVLRRHADPLGSLDAGHKVGVTRASHGRYRSGIRDWCVQPCLAFTFATHPKGSPRAAVIAVHVGQGRIE